MTPATKIATCCYCGTRSALVLDKARHELACASCGAQLHNLKQLKAPAKAPVQRDAAKKASKKRSKPKRKPQKSFASSLFEVAFDLIEDIID